MGSDYSMHLNPGVCVCVCVSLRVCVCLFEADSTVMFCVCLCRSVRPRLTVYVCQESPVVERHGTNENGENSISPGLHGEFKKKKPNIFQLCGFLLCATSRLRVCAVYHALYLEELTAAELIRKIACVCSLPLGTINQVYRQGPTGILILLSDQVYGHVHTQNMTTFKFTPRKCKKTVFFLRWHNVAT